MHTENYLSTCGMTANNLKASTVAAFVGRDKDLVAVDALLRVHSLQVSGMGTAARYQVQLQRLGND